MTAQIDNSFTFKNRPIAWDTSIFYMTWRIYTVPWLSICSTCLKSAHTEWEFYYAGDDIAWMPMTGVLACVCSLGAVRGVSTGFSRSVATLHNFQKRNSSDGFTSLQPISADRTWGRCMFHWCQENWGQTDRGILLSWLLWLSRPLREYI